MFFFLTISSFIYFIIFSIPLYSLPPFFLFSYILLSSLLLLFLYHIFFLPDFLSSSRKMNPCESTFLLLFFFFLLLFLFRGRNDYLSSPVLLFPSSSSSSLQIKMVADVPGVGMNLNDHPYLTGLAWTIHNGSSFNIFDTAQPSVITEYVISRSGE